MTAATVVTRRFRRMPDFAGVALVDILANGVAMLIIVIVLSIAARMEREERYAEQASEVATVMSHKFSTSLVLNSLAASPPARLHDYENSPLDRILDPEILPILELHGGFVREFYSGAIWTRRDLLEEHGGLGAWLAGLGDQARARLRVDVYDIPQFYVTMSILREHGIRVFHWHFLSGALSRREAARCPPGMAAKDCAGGENETAAPLPQLALEDRGAGGLGGRESPLFEPPSGIGRGSGGGAMGALARDGTGSSPGPMPGGVVPGMAGSAGAGFGGQGTSSGPAQAGSAAGGGDPGAAGSGRGAAGGEPGAAGMERGLLSGPQTGERARGFGSDSGLDPGTAATLGSFPNASEGGAEPSSGRGDGRAARGGQGRSRGERASRGGEGQGGEGPQISLRIALPESIRRRAQSGSEGLPALEALFGVILHYLAGLQNTLDTGGTPSPQIDGFAERIQRAFRTPPDLTAAERQVARDLALKFALLPHLGTPDFRPEPLELRTARGDTGADAVLVVEPNRLNDVVGVDRGAASVRAGAEEGEEGTGARGDGALPGRGRVHLALNAYPGIWKGLEIEIEPYSVVLMPPEAREPERMRWRAAAYITPRLDDFIVGFVFASVDTGGALRAQADANRAQVDGRPLFTEYRESAFGSRGWLVTLYAALAAGLALVAVGWRYLSGRTA